MNTLIKHTFQMLTALALLVSVEVLAQDIGARENPPRHIRSRESEGKEVVSPRLVPRSTSAKECGAAFWYLEECGERQVVVPFIRLQCAVCQLGSRC